jgi:hypothetical protein
MRASFIAVGSSIKERSYRDKMSGPCGEGWFLAEFILSTGAV